MTDLFEVRRQKFYVAQHLKIFLKTSSDIAHFTQVSQFRATAKNLSLTLSVASHHFDAFPSSFPYSLPMLMHHPSENCPFPSHSSMAIMVYLIFLIQSRIPKPCVILNSFACNSLPYYIIPLAKISSAPQRGTQYTFLLPKVLSHSQFDIPFFSFSEVNDIFLHFIGRHYQAQSGCAHQFFLVYLGANTFILGFNFHLLQGFYSYKQG